ncbi:unnamed protein product [Parnassius apollo]|uniref:(apollo) hypothetical protein n=1 Tax=Parnassius apollo TaxID=110799 RepID=A0A8S3XHC3_PARAO|nr:unnamed protein product [Parnassius apollo]
MVTAQNDREQQEICSVKALSDYMNRTRDLREESGSDKLISTIRKPTRNAIAQSLSRWMKQILKDSGIDVNAYSSHSTRHASTSAAKRAGVSIDVIKSTAGCSNASLCFAKFYNLPLKDGEQDRAFADAVFSRDE